MTETDAVTGPFSYTGKYIAERLARQKVAVRGLVRRQPPDPGSVDCRPLQFSDPEKLAADLEGVRVLYNTYWIRFERDGETFAGAVKNTGTLARAARRAGVEKIVHISVSNPSPESPFAYFRGKAAAEIAVREPGVPCSIIRPTLVFGKEDILINNITWMLRRFHVFPVPGSGRYHVQPVFVGDVADSAVAAGMGSDEGVTDAAGPEVFSFSGLLRMLAYGAGTFSFVVPVPFRLALAGGSIMSRIVGDVAITDEELGALMAETLVSREGVSAPTKLTDWLAANGSGLGRSYTSELKRHWQR